MERPARAAALLARLKALYPGAHCELEHRNPFELLVATILSAQCTDVRVNKTTPELFRRFPTAEAMAAAKTEELEAIIRPTGFYRNKAKSILGAARALVDQHGGNVPCDLETLHALPGVGRKTANVVLGDAFGIQEGIVVDTHVGRLARRFGLTRHQDAVKVEFALMPLIPRGDWTRISHLLIWHGRRRCKAQNPDCAGCELRDLCPSVDRAAPKKRRPALDKRRDRTKIKP
ncbi:MAG: endonuclease III [Candidatus Methylacidiphilales bacterium]|nr:endonuclease III [Candidatus Methylacidiphilales bacterium]